MGGRMKPLLPPPPKGFEVEGMRLPRQGEFYLAGGGWKLAYCDFDESDGARIVAAKPEKKKEGDA